jgi:hypothetical protein
MTKRQATRVVPIRNPSKIIPFSSPKARLIAWDDQSRRVIVGIGRQRIALDFSTRITELRPACITRAKRRKWFFVGAITLCSPKRSRSSLKPGSQLVTK